MKKLYTFEFRSSWAKKINENFEELAGATGGDVTISWSQVEDKPTVIAAGATAADARTALGMTTIGSTLATAADQAAARTAIGAGTSSLAIGTTATTAAAGNHTHTGAQIALTGFTAGTAGAVAATDTVNAAIAKLQARIAALEAAAA